MFAYYHYYLILFFLLFLILAESFSNVRTVRPALVFVCFLILGLYAGLRGYVFQDYGAYVKFYHWTYDLESYLHFGEFFRYIQAEYFTLLTYSIVKTLSGGPTVAMMIFALMSVGINLYCYNRYSPYVFTSILIYFSHNFLNKELAQVRAGIASAFVLLSVEFIKRKNLPLFILMIVIGMQFHTAAIIALPMYWVAQKQFSRRFLFMTISIGLVMGMSGWLDHFIGILSALNALPHRVGGYVGAEGRDYSLGIANPLTLKQIFVCSLAIYGKDKISEKVPYFYPLLVFYVCATAWLLAFQDFAILAARVATFLSVGDPIILPSLVYMFREKRVVLAGAALSACAMLMINLLFKGFAPYQSILYYVW